MKQQYEENVYILKERIEEGVEKEYVPKARWLVLEDAYIGLCIFLMGAFMKIMMDKVVLYGIGSLQSVQSVMIQNGWSNGRIAYFLNTLDILSSIILIIGIVGGVMFVWMGVESYVQAVIQSSEWLRYFGVPVMGAARKVVNKYLVDYAYLNEVDFKAVEKYLGEQTIKYVAEYDRVMAIHDPNREQLKYLLMMNLLGAIAQEKKWLDRIEKHMLIKEIRAVAKKLE